MVLARELELQLKREAQLGSSRRLPTRSINLQDDRSQCGTSSNGPQMLDSCSHEKSPDSDPSGSHEPAQTHPESFLTAFSDLPSNRSTSSDDDSTSTRSVAEQLDTRLVDKFLFSPPLRREPSMTGAQNWNVPPAAPLGSLRYSTATRSSDTEITPHKTRFAPLKFLRSATNESSYEVVLNDEGRSRDAEAVVANRREQEIGRLSESTAQIQKKSKKSFNKEKAKKREAEERMRMLAMDGLI